jgi:serine/threonine protein kinase
MSAMKGDELVARLVTGYHSLSVLHRGKGAVVYHAMRDGAGAPAVLKVLRLDEQVRPVTDEESSSTLRLSEHPHIATLYGTGVTTTGRPYVAMEYCPEGSYADALVRQGPLEVSEVVEVGGAIAAALAAAHSAGLLHRAVTPANILRGRSGPVLADFPMCRIPEELADQFAGAIPHHRPPEALRGEPQSPASDVYGLASTLWTLLAGRPPFTEPGAEPDLLVHRERALNEPAPPVPNAAVPTGLQRVLARALAKDPGERYADAEEFAAALAAVDTRTLPATASPEPEAAPRPQTPAPAPEPDPATSTSELGGGWTFFDGQPDLARSPGWTDEPERTPPPRSALGDPKSSADPHLPAFPESSADPDLSAFPESSADPHLPAFPESSADPHLSAFPESSADPDLLDLSEAVTDPYLPVVPKEPEDIWDLPGGRTETAAPAWTDAPPPDAPPGEQTPDTGWLDLPGLRPGTAAEPETAPGPAAEPDAAPAKRPDPQEAGIPAPGEPDAIPAPPYTVGLEQRPSFTNGPEPEEEADPAGFQIDYRTEVQPEFGPPDESGYEQIPPGHRGPPVKPLYPHRRRSAYIAAGAIGLMLGLIVVVAGLGGGEPDDRRGTTAVATPSPEGTLIKPRTNGPHTPQQVRITDRQVAAALTWRDGSGGKASYYVVGGPTGRTPTTLAEVPTGDTRVEVSGLNPAVNYCFTVVAVLNVDQVAAAAPVCTKRRT